MAHIIIIGGGISGLINSILLSRAGFDVMLLEKYSYPLHRVCGEYISKEVIPFLRRHELYPNQHRPSDIDQLEITTLKGEVLRKSLDLGGFGLSRYAFDHFLAEKAIESGVLIHENTVVKGVKKQALGFLVETATKSYQTDLIIGAQGKRSAIDKHLERSYIDKRSPYVGVKYHLRGPLKPEVISLHNFEGGYCGINQIEDDKFNLCYLIHRDQVRKMGSISACENELLSENPHLNKVFETSEFLFRDPLVINEVSFSIKGLSKDGVLFSGDAAGTIAPFSGNGMAMAIKSAKYLSESIIQNWNASGPDHARIFKSYSRNWNTEFAGRISRGQKIQRLFGHPMVSQWSVRSGKTFPFFVNPIIKMTHGQPFS